MEMKVGLTASTFDLLHAGHVMMLREAKSQCDWLIAALQVDPSYDRKKKLLLFKLLSKDKHSLKQ